MFKLLVFFILHNDILIPLHYNNVVARIKREDIKMT